MILDPDAVTQIDVPFEHPGDPIPPPSDLGGQPSPVTNNEPQFLFGWMFGKPLKPHPKEDADIYRKLGELGKKMMEAGPPDKPGCNNPDWHGVPAGYTYLGQFIAHEITSDKTPPVQGSHPFPVNWRSPQIDLDSLYGGDSIASPQLYESDGIHLKVGSTYHESAPMFDTDLPRDPTTKEAILVDPRNDENLAVAQTHVAFIRFHNAVVDVLANQYPAAELFKRAQEQVVRHFQWIIVNDYLPRIIDEDVLKAVVAKGQPKWLKNGSPVFMPLEFSAAAFRLGHSMVRPDYQWNGRRNRQVPNSPASLGDLFGQTARNGDLGGKPRLANDWAIDWRRFYDFTDLNEAVDRDQFNLAQQIDTKFDMNLETIAGFDHQGAPVGERHITTRNLRAGFRLGLPTGEEVASRINQQPLDPIDIIGNSSYKDLLSDAAFYGRTPLWYYILREAELECERNGVSRLGPVGSHIVAETFVALIYRSRYSIFDNWTPTFGRPTQNNGPRRFKMIDLLDMAFKKEGVNPLG